MVLKIANMMCEITVPFSNQFSTVTLICLVFANLYCQGNFAEKLLIGVT